jgi:hypothetical protein
MRFFNTAGPVNPADHYCIPPLTRFDLGEILQLIQQKKYFVLHAPRQVGKTSFLLALADYLNQQGDYRALYVNVEAAQATREEIEASMQVILGAIASAARDFLHDPLPSQIMKEVLEQYGSGALYELLTRWAHSSLQPLVLLIDEIDALIGDTLISVLRQLRAGYYKRPQLFPQSVILCGVRDVRDYRIHSSQERSIITGGSAFNVKATSLRMDDFDQEDIKLLYAQHTQETAQPFAPEVLLLVWELTQGQPWLVNALGYEVCFAMKTGRNRTLPITREMILTAKENLILRREIHLDQLIDKLQETRVQRVIGPMLTGQSLDQSVREDDIQYVVDLGLVRRGPWGPQIANPIYREVIPRELTFITQLNFESTVQTTWYVTNDGQLEIDALLRAFQGFFRQHSEHWVERFDYKEAGPQLLLQAFLQRLVNGGGRIEREYGLGRKRTDLLLLWPYGEPPIMQKVVFELKIRHETLEDTIKEGLEQTWQYMDRADTTNGHLIIFDRDPHKPWAEKIFTRTELYRQMNIQIWGM